MQTLIHQAKSILNKQNSVPFSVYSSFKEQRLFNVPIVKPILILVLDGHKKLGGQSEQTCSTGEFIILSNATSIDMRNIPSESTYFALIIEFEYADFECFKERTAPPNGHISGPIDQVLYQTVSQFLDWSCYAPVELWSQRRQEILNLLYLQGYKDVSGIFEPPSLSHRIQKLISDNVSGDVTMELLSSTFAMSESTVRRKLQKEGTTLQSLKDQIKLGTALHLLQTTNLSISNIADQCGYQSQSRFTEKFKDHFKLTPSSLRKTRLPD